jgi:hypothetical protein
MDVACDVALHVASDDTWARRCGNKVGHYGALWGIARRIDLANVVPVHIQAAGRYWVVKERGATGHADKLKLEQRTEKTRPSIYMGWFGGRQKWKLRNDKGLTKSKNLSRILVPHPHPPNGGRKAVAGRDLTQNAMAVPARRPEAAIASASARRMSPWKRGVPEQDAIAGERSDQQAQTNTSLNRRQPRQQSADRRGLNHGIHGSHGRRRAQMGHRSGADGTSR